ncbi:cupin [Brevibacillus parabrevis]|uniref:cupin domain-containing protein n=1 Tax=Brevibacillus parabrevis TaxID=54914 RepID=UPI0007ABBFA6|nr:cupin domain-containing protein [Brevibacillus parabrevis]KZE47145.1 cupin [Brevibacillus parabrevis]
MYPSHYGYPWHHPVAPVNWDHSSWGHHWHPAYYPWYSNWEDSWNRVELKDYGPYPLAINIDEATKQNNYYRSALWTGKHLQVTLMSIPVGGDIGLEMHPDTDQFLRIEEGHGLVQMGARKDRLDYQARLNDDYAVMVPAGTWHNIINTGNEPLKLYSIYAPPHHPQGTVHRTKAAAMAEERHHS